MKTSKFFLSTLIAAAAMTSTAYATDISAGTSTTLSPSGGVYSEGVTYAYSDPDSTGKFAWLGLGNIGGSTTNSFGTEENPMALSGVGGAIGIFYQAGNNTANYDTFNLLNVDASSFSGKLIVLNQWNNNTNVLLQGDTWENVEYLMGSASRNEGWGETYARGYGNSGRGLDTLTLTANTSLAGITGATKGLSHDQVSNINLKESIVASAAGTTLTLTGGGNSTAFAYYGAFGTSTTAIGLNVTGGNQTLGGTSYLGSVSVSNGTLKLGGTVTLNETISVTDGTLEFLDGVVVKIGEIIDLTDAIIPTDSNGYAEGGVKIYELSSGTVSGSLDSVTDANGHEYSVEDGVASVTDYRTYYVNTGTVNYSTISGNSALTSVQIADGATMVLDVGETSSTISTGFSGEGTLQKTGTGRTTLSGQVNEDIALDIQSGWLKVSSLDSTSISIKEGAVLNYDEHKDNWSVDGKTFKVSENDGTTQYAWIYTGATGADQRNFDQDFGKVTLSGSGDFGIAYTTGYQQTTITLTGMTASDFTGRILVINDYGRPTKVSLAGDQLENAEYVFGSVAVDSEGSEGYYGLNTTYQADNAYTLEITDDATLAGITGAVKTGNEKYVPEYVTAASGATLTLTGGDSTYSGYTNNGAFVYNGKFGASNAAINLTVSGANQTLGGETYIGALNITKEGSLSVGGGTTSITSATMSSGTTIEIAGSEKVTLGTVGKATGDTTGGNLILDSSSVNLVLTGVVNLNRMTVGSTISPKTVSIDFGTEGLIRTTFDSSWNGGGIDFGASVKGDEGGISFTVSFDENLFEGGSEIVKRDLLIAENNGGNGIWNFSDAKALDVIVNVTGYTFGENSFVGLCTSEEELLNKLDVGKYGILLSQNAGGANVEGVSYATLVLSVPEPSAFGLLVGVGALALVAARRRRRK